MLHTRAGRNYFHATKKGRAPLNHDTHCCHLLKKTREKTGRQPLIYSQTIKAKATTWWNIRDVQHSESEHKYSVHALLEASAMSTLLDASHNVYVVQFGAKKRKKGEKTWPAFCKQKSEEESKMQITTPKTQSSNNIGCCCRSLVNLWLSLSEADAEAAVMARKKKTSTISGKWGKF